MLTISINKHISTTPFLMETYSRTCLDSWHFVLSNSQCCIEKFYYKNKALFFYYKNKLFNLCMQCILHHLPNKISQASCVYLTLCVCYSCSVHPSPHVIIYSKTLYGHLLHARHYVSPKDAKINRTWSGETITGTVSSRRGCGQHSPRI